MSLLKLAGAKASLPPRFSESTCLTTFGRERSLISRTCSKRMFEAKAKGVFCKDQACEQSSSAVEMPVNDISTLTARRARNEAKQ